MTDDAVPEDAATDGDVAGDDLPDDALAEEVRSELGRAHDVVAVAAVVPDGSRAGVVGAPADARLEIGSVSKGLTGMLYADALTRGEVAPTTPLGSLLPALDGSPAGGVTLASLATHTSGLPRLPAAMQPWRRTVALCRHGTNPYGDSLEETLAQARAVALGRPRFGYSNLGFALLGHAVAAAAGRPYRRLLTERLGSPLDLELHVAHSPDELGPRDLSGRSRGGRPRERWTGEGIAPAGGVRTTAASLARLLRALVGGTAPGAGALDPVAPIGRDAAVGAGWVTTTTPDGGSVTWHNGGTGGFRSWVGVDRAAGTGFAVVSATSSSVDRVGFRRLKSLAAP
nr:serine hydrolase domain-containing protein [uncultured Actinotalea sp.]